MRTAILDCFTTTAFWSRLQNQDAAHVKRALNDLPGVGRARVAEYTEPLVGVIRSTLTALGETPPHASRPALLPHPSPVPLASARDAAAPFQEGALLPDFAVWT